MLPMEVRAIAIMSRDWAEQHEVLTVERSDAAQETYASRHANGTGPFRLVAIEPRKTYALERNPIGGVWNTGRLRSSSSR